jgi:predicted Ser/Thr protein kinase
VSNMQATSTTQLHGMRLRLAQAVWILTGLIFAGAYVFLLILCLRGSVTNPALPLLGLSPEILKGFWFGLDLIFMTACLSVAALIFWRKSNDPVALLLSTGVIAAGFGSSQLFNGNTKITIGLLPAWSEGQFAVGATLWTLAVILVMVFFCLFPTGRFVPRWMQWVMCGWIAFLPVVSTATRIGLVPESALVVAYWIAQTLFFGAAVYGQFVRYRSSTAVQRQQTKLFLLAMLAVIMGTVLDQIIALTAVRTWNDSPVFALIVVTLSYTFIRWLPVVLFPVLLGFSILKYRLWDIDFIINSALVYGALSTFLAAILALSLFVISLLFQNFAGGPVVAVAISAVAFGLAFQPLRRRLQRFVDRRFYGIEIDYQKANTPDTMAVRAAPQKSIGPYTGVTLIGKGGMGEVYRAQHRADGSTVAIKIMPAEIAKEPDFRKRFEREARLASQLQHPNIIRMMEFGEESGVPYLVMEYIDGLSLASALEQRGRMNLVQAVPIIEGVARALDYAHAQGLVHRDVKPANVMLDRTRPVLMDFGIARMIGGASRYTQTGSVLGSLNYMAPEQIQAASDVDHRADIYAFGVMIYEMLTGELPFKKDNAGALLLAHMMQPPPDPRKVNPDLPEEAAEVVWRAMGKKPEDRFASAGEMVETLCLTATT